MQNNPKIIISRKNDPDPMIILPGTTTEIVDMRNALILEEGTTTGKTSVALHGVSEDGTRNILIRLTAEQIMQISDALVGAEIYFKNVPKDKVAEADKCNLDPTNKGFCKECRNLAGGCPIRNYHKNK